MLVHVYADLIAGMTGKRTAAHLVTADKEIFETI
jgi:hypothetical protein